MKFLIAGLGSIGRRHLRNLLLLGEKDIVLYRTHHSTLPEDDLKSFKTETNLIEAFSHNPDAVIVSNPTALHLQVAMPAVQAGCHLLVEKPVAAKFDQKVDQLLSAVSASDIHTLVGFQFRFHPVLTQIKDLLDSGELGSLYSFRVHWGEYLPGWHPWEDYRKSYAARQDLGGGVVNTLCHPLDYVRWLFGEVTSLYAVTDHVSDLEMDVEDVAEIVLTLNNGCVGSVHLDYFQRPPAHWLEVNCEKGHIRWDNDSGAAKVFLIEGERWENFEPPVGFDRNQLFIDEMQHFISLVNGEINASRCSLQDGIRALELTEAVHASSLHNKKIMV